jgi:diacylglycerol kinase family enzyme
MQHTVQIVVTPGSGEGRALATAARIRTLVTRRGYQASIRTFQDLASLTAWAKTSAQDFAYLVCVGGDATQSAAAAAAIRLGVPFVPVPNGFGNIFAQAFGHSGDAAGVTRLLEDGEIRRVDVGVCENEVFLSHRSYGFLEQVQQAAEAGRRQPRSRLLRHLWYYGIAKRALLEMPTPSIDVEIDGTMVARGAMLVTVANVETYRGFLSLTPKASPIDGRFDVLTVPRTGKLRLFVRLLRIMLRLPHRWNGVALHRGRRVVVTVDGRREELRTARHVLPLMVPRGAMAALTRRQVEEDAPVQDAA